MLRPLSVAATASAPAQSTERMTARKPRIGVLRFLKRLGKELLADRIDDVGAMMAYYAVLALFPMLIFVVVIDRLRCSRCRRQ